MTAKTHRYARELALSVRDKSTHATIRTSLLSRDVFQSVKKGRKRKRENERGREKERESSADGKGEEGD